MKVHPLRPKPILPERIVTQCEATSIEWKNWAPHYVNSRRKKIERRGWDENKCNKPATYYFNGEHLCTQHAANKALKMMCEQSED